MTIQQIEQLLKPEIAKCKRLECDGTTRVVSYILNKNNIKHKVYIGSVEYDYVDKNLKSYENVQDTVDLHCWIVLETNQIVDYKLQMWLNHPRVPNGIFLASEYPHIKYDGEVATTFVCDEKMYKILMLQNI